VTLLADNHYLRPRTPEMNDPNARSQLGEVGQTTAPDIRIER
jgi:hypothetical protein